MGKRQQKKAPPKSKAKRPPKKQRKPKTSVEDLDDEAAPAEATTAPAVRKEMADVVKEYGEKNKMLVVHSVVSIDQWDDFMPDRFYTGVVDLDIGLLPRIGGRVCIVGEESTGKSLTSYILEGAAYRTCRRCFRPIISWTNPETGEVKSRCKCGKNDRMVVLRIETEDRFDPAWANVWGRHIGEIEVTDKGEFVLRKSKDKKYWVATPTEGDAAYNFAADAVKSGAVDFVMIDSIAMLTPKAVIENESGDLLGEKVGSHAMLTNRGLKMILRAQVDARHQFGAKVTVMWTTQYYMGPTRNPKQDPRVVVGGMKTRYIEDCRMKIVSCRPEYNTAEGVDRGSRFADIEFEIWKQKGDIPHRRGGYRVYLDTMQAKHSIMHPGDTDEADRILAYLTDLGYFVKEKDGYHCLRKVFKKVSDLRAFFLDPSVNYPIRYLILREKLSSTARLYLKKEQFDYDPWKNTVLSVLSESEEEDPVSLPPDAAPPGRDQPGKDPGGEPAESGGDPGEGDPSTWADDDDLGEGKS